MARGYVDDEAIEEAHSRIGVPAPAGAEPVGEHRQVEVPMPVAEQHAG